MELEELHSRMHEVWQAHDELVFITGAADGVTGQGLDSRLRALEHDMQQVHVKTEELDRHINKMLTKMVEFANQGGKHFGSHWVELGNIQRLKVQSIRILNLLCTFRQESIVGVVWLSLFICFCLLSLYCFRHTFDRQALCC